MSVRKTLTIVTVTRSARILPQAALHVHVTMDSEAMAGHVQVCVSLGHQQIWQNSSW